AAAERAIRSTHRTRRLVARLRQQVRREPRQLAPRKMCTNVDPVRSIDALLKGRAERVQLREPRSLVVREQHPDCLEPLVEPLCDTRSKLVEPFARRRRHQKRAGVPAREASPPQWI